MTQIEILKDRDKADGVRYRHVSWGPEGVKLTEEEKAAYLNKVLDQVAAEQADTVEIPVCELTAIYESLLEIRELSRINIRDWLDGKIPKEVLDLKSKIRTAVGMSVTLAEQILY
jgi:hypothetical protein